MIRTADRQTGRHGRKNAGKFNDKGHETQKDNTSLTVHEKRLRIFFLPDFMSRLTSPKGYHMEGRKGFSKPKGTGFIGKQQLIKIFKCGTLCEKVVVYGFPLYCQMLLIMRLYLICIRSS